MLKRKTSLCCFSTRNLFIMPPSVFLCIKQKRAARGYRLGLQRWAGVCHPDPPSLSCLRGGSAGCCKLHAACAQPPVPESPLHRPESGSSGLRPVRQILLPHPPCLRSAHCIPSATPSSAVCAGKTGRGGAGAGLAVGAGPRCCHSDHPQPSP